MAANKAFLISFIAFSGAIFSAVKLVYTMKTQLKSVELTLVILTNIKVFLRIQEDLFYLL